LENPDQNLITSDWVCPIYKARSILLTSNLPKTYWAKAVNTACLISNMLSTPSRSNFSPYELWTKTCAPIHRLRTFGCKAFINVPKEDRSWKLGNKGDLGILVGFENKASSYRIIRLRDGKLVQTRNARFDETSFPTLSGKTAFSSEKEDSFYFDSFEESVSLDENIPAIANEQVEPENEPDSESCQPAKIKVIGPRHPTLIVGDISESNILPFSCRRPQAFVTSTIGSVPTHFHQATKGADSFVIPLRLTGLRQLKS
jgi:hypothetical protein